MNDTTNDMNSWLDRVIREWSTKNINLNKGASVEAIRSTETLIDYTFPPAFKALYGKVNGFFRWEWNENMIGIWELNRIEEEYGRYQNFVGFGDFLINSHVYGFCKEQSGIFKHYDFAEERVPEKIAETFEEAIIHINENSDLLY